MLLSISLKFFTELYYAGQGKVCCRQTFERPSAGFSKEKACTNSYIENHHRAVSEIE